MITRRAFTTLPAAMLGATIAPHAAEVAALGRLDSEAQTVAEPDDTLRSELLFDLTLETQPPTPIGSPAGDRLIVSVAGGTFHGPKMQGTVASGGDWIVRRPDGTNILDVRIVLLTDDKQTIYTTWRGLAYTEAGGVLVARIVPFFETSSANYTWLNNVVAVGVYRPQAGKIIYRVYRIL